MKCCSPQLKSAESFFSSAGFRRWDGIRVRPEQSGSFPHELKGIWGPHNPQCSHSQHWLLLLQRIKIRHCAFIQIKAASRAHTCCSIIQLSDVMCTSSPFVTDGLLIRSGVRSQVHSMTQSPASRSISQIDKLNQPIRSGCYLTGSYSVDRDGSLSAPQKWKKSCFVLRFMVNLQKMLEDNRPAALQSNITNTTSVRLV